MGVYLVLPCCRTPSLPDYGATTVVLQVLKFSVRESWAPTLAFKVIVWDFLKLMYSRSKDEDLKRDSWSRVVILFNNYYFNDNGD